MKFKPLHNWVLLTRTAPEEMTSGGIIIPDAARRKPVEGLVKAIGPGRYAEKKGTKEKRFVPTVLTPGQRVMFVEYMAKEITFDGTEVIVIREDDILGIVDNSGALAIKEHYNIEVKKNHPPMVQTETSKAVTKLSPAPEVPFNKALKTGKTGEKVKTKTDTKKSSSKRTASKKK